MHCMGGGDGVKVKVEFTQQPGTKAQGGLEA